MKKIGKIVKGIGNALGVIGVLSLVIAWCVSVVCLSYGLAVWSFQWFMGLI